MRLRKFENMGAQFLIQKMFDTGMQFLREASNKFKNKECE